MVIIFGVFTTSTFLIGSTILVITGSTIALATGLTVLHTSTGSIIFDQDAVVTES